MSQVITWAEHSAKTDPAYTLPRFHVKGVTGFSIGAVYASILNLPRSICFKPEYTTLLTVMPGEPSLTQLNSILKPIVDDLKVRISNWRVGFRLTLHLDDLSGV